MNKIILKCRCDVCGNNVPDIGTATFTSRTKGVTYMVLRICDDCIRRINKERDAFREEKREE
jgi:hypothetical protein